MKLKFDANQQFQKDAIDSIVDIFDGQELRHSEFTAFRHNDTLFGAMNELGYGNKLDLTPEDLLKNVVAVQDRNKLPRSRNIIDPEYDVPNYAIEMETGTGKTYAYTRTAFELNKKYGFSKFIVVVPSVAIREGINKSLEVTEEHFSELYPGQPIHYFIYNSTKLNEVRSFARSDAIEVMIINIDAFRKGYSDYGGDIDLEKKANVIHKPHEDFEDNPPIYSIQQTNPIVIIDEPQSVDNTDKAKEAIKSLNPLFVLRYSATHKNTYNLMYRLGPVEAHDHKLVKTIEVLSIQDDKSDKAYVQLIKVSKSGSVTKAKVEINCLDMFGKVSKKEVMIKTGDDLYDYSNGNNVYNQHVIASINIASGDEYIELEDGSIIRPNEGGNDDEIKRAQIHNTIKAHLEKELVLVDKDIKVISLFFIDKVAHYREYEDVDGEVSVKKGKYAQMFEEEYAHLIQLDKYKTLFNTEKTDSYVLNSKPEEVHDGYFSQDKKGILKDTAGTTLADEDAYTLIMKDKERLLSFDTPLRFIFSHSTLKEGWDNPNVFQVCTLVETHDTMTKRQKIGRGLRLPVYSAGPKRGERALDEQFNILTVVANESYESFAENLQMEIETETNTRFGVIDERLFEHIIRNDEIIGYDEAKKIHDHLVQEGLVDRHGKATPELKNKIALGEFEMPEEYSDIKEDIELLIKSVTRRLPILDANDRVEFKLNKEVYLSNDFKELWNRIKHKTVYRLHFSPDELIEDATTAIKGMRPIKPNAIVAKYVRLRVEREGITFDEPNRIHKFVRENYRESVLPNLLSYVEQYTGLKRSSIVKILIDSGRLDEFYSNSQVFMEQVVEQINIAKRKLIIDGIEYEKIGDETYWAQDMFEDEELIGYIKDNALPVDKSVYSHIVYDSTTIEKPFAERLNSDDDVKLFVKLPNWFKIDTPLGTYNPDWAIVLDKNGVERLYFVIETKGSILNEDLRALEINKIECGRKHFAAINDEVIFDKATDYDFWKEGV
ncbi:MAG: DEAD/DEAH box helicase family protein [Nanoarchaeota archaeon]|nr:DEAD/DEAH box helicase family protein [Nanoarchaeota archaeon]